MVDELYRKEKSSLENKSLFKGKDLGFLKEVVDYLWNYNLEAELKGSALYNTLKDNPRHYNDIDLAVKTDNIKIGSNEYIKYVEAIQDLTKLSSGKEYKNWIVEDETEGFSKYVGLDIEYKFRIKNPKTKTSIDVAFGKQNGEEDLRGEGLDLPVSNISLMHFAPKKKRK